MSLKNKTHRVKTWVDSFCLTFTNDGGAGYSFDGVQDDDGFRMDPRDDDIRRQSFENALQGFQEGQYTVRIENRGNWDVEPAHGTCVCGREVYLEYDYGHGIDCDCGRIYNQSGQELAPRSQWEDHYSEESTQPYCVEFGYAGDDY